jgi:hypothetical protein
MSSDLSVAGLDAEPACTKSPRVKRTVTIALVSSEGKSREAYRLTDKGLVAVSSGGEPGKGHSPDVEVDRSPASRPKVLADDVRTAQPL